ncbi:HECT-type E3 ubiquitin transferase [Aspergillus undulatus]|uniref:HECT-type E3 ubiquitin transferase n=1 Tax=Aspergillus undulatus TaxID=1810928 RepID=UPI003CCE3AEA
MAAPMAATTDQKDDTDRIGESLTLHAEYLPNIRQVSVQISIAGATNSNVPPQISLSESRRAVSVSVSDYASETIKLPARVTEGSRRLLGGAGAGTGAARDSADARELSYRMQVDDSEMTQRNALDEHMDIFVPWSAGDMFPSTKLRCGQCEGVILDTPNNTAEQPSSAENNASLSGGWVWKDLPSGNWAEMMDFWHCHKPDPPKTHDANGKKVEDVNSNVKGYGASNQVLAAPGNVLVDVATFLVSSIECKGLKKVTKGRTDDFRLPSEEELVCSKCEALIGVEDTIAKGWRLFKTSLAASFPSIEEGCDEVSWEKHPTELVVTAQLLELIERESARRFIIHCGKKDGLLVWVFNPDMRYSNASSQHSITSQRAMKVFFQATADAETMLYPEPGKASPLSLEELRLPVDTYASISATLEASNGRLPPSARIFQNAWRVGVLHRFESLKR